MPPVLRDDISSSPILPPADTPALPTEGAMDGFSLDSTENEDDATSGSPASSFALFSSNNTPVNPRKRVGEDLTQVAQEAGRLCKLRKSSQSELIAMTSMSTAERQIQLAALVLGLRDQFNTLGSGASTAKPFNIPSSMRDFIDKQSFIILMRPNLARYTDREDDGLDEINEQGPKETLWSLIQRTPHIGFQATMRTDTSVKQVIMSHIRVRLNQRRCAIKGKIESSLGGKPGKTGDVPPQQDILQLTRSVIQILKSARVRVTYELCARIAYLRNAFQIAQGKDKDYWFVVDMELFQTRKLAQAKQDKYIQRILDADITNFGLPVDLEHLRKPLNGNEGGSEDEGAVSQEL